MCFDLIDLFAKSGLGNVQPVSSASEIQLLGQHVNCPQMTHFDPWEHSSNPFRQTSEIG
jgi:hypothetical protein